MIELLNINKYYRTRQGNRQILSDLDLKIEPGERVGILGRNGAGKSTLIRLIAGSEQPSSGTIHRSMSVSWPLAFGGGFQGSLTGLDNLRFTCRVYGASYKNAVPFVEEFSELGQYLREPNQDRTFRPRQAKTVSHSKPSRKRFLLPNGVRASTT